jgi:arylsulfatase
MIARWPNKIEPGAISEHIGHVNDFMPTVIEMSGADYPAIRDGVDVLPLEGESLLPALRGEVEPPPRFLHWGLYGNRAVRQGKLKVDRSETRDVIENHPNQARRMRVSWERWAKKTGYPLTGYGL